MSQLNATRLTEFELGQAAADPAIEIAPDVCGLFPDRLEDPTVDARFYIVMVPRRQVDFVGVVAAPAPHPAPTIAALRRAARRAA